MKVLKILRKLFISVFVVIAFLICVDRLKNFEKFKNFLESKKVERSMKKELKAEISEKTPGFPGRKYITIR